MVCTKNSPKQIEYKSTRPFLKNLIFYNFNQRSIYDLKSEIDISLLRKSIEIKKPSNKVRRELKKLLPLQTSVILLLCIRGLQVKTLKNARKGDFFRENIVGSFT